MTKKAPPPNEQAIGNALALIEFWAKTPARQRADDATGQVDPTTSSESSYPNLNLRLTAQKQTNPATSPIAMADIGETKPAPGVMATRPATAPEAAPSVVGFPVFIHSATTQPSAATEAAIWVVTKALIAIPSAARAEPALNPNQPNQRMPVPIRVSGSECGRIASAPNPLRGPRANTRARAAMPALM